MGWMQSLMRLADLEVENLQKRLRDISDRKAVMDCMLACLDEEAASEAASATADAQAGWYLAGFREGWKARRAKVQADLNACSLEEQGARDALSRAFEEQKKFESLAETARLADAKETNRREGLVLDELALRRVASR